MVKYANKPKGRPTKRKTLKVKYKIERKVKQHKKRVRKEARKLRGEGLKHKGEARAEYLPNMFPFKPQILEEAKRAKPKQTEAEVQTLDQTLYGLTNIENKCAYLPKPKDNLIKKYINNLEAILPNVNICLEVLEVRNPEACIDHEFRAKCQANNIRIVTILSKTDTLKGAEAKQSLHPSGGKVLKFTTDHKYKSTYVEDIIAALKEAGEGRVFVAGKPLTGKHTLITQIAKHLGKYQESPYELNLIKITPTLALIDSPYRLADTTSYPLFALPNPILEESLFAQEEATIRSLFLDTSDRKSLFHRNDVLEYFAIQDFSTVSELLSKVGRAWKLFGKGGSVDVARVRTRILSDWFSGKLNQLLPH